jgi:hypothetical protein
MIMAYEMKSLLYKINRYNAYLVCIMRNNSSPFFLISTLMSY